MGGARGIGVGWEERVGAVSGGCQIPAPQSKLLPSCRNLVGGRFPGSYPVSPIVCSWLPGQRGSRLRPLHAWLHVAWQGQ